MFFLPFTLNVMLPRFTWAVLIDSYSAFIFTIVSIAFFTHDKGETHYNYVWDDCLRKIEILLREKKRKKKTLLFFRMTLWLTLVDCERRGLCIKIKKGEPETKEPLLALLMEGWRGWGVCGQDCVLRLETRFILGQRRFPALICRLRFCGERYQRENACETP